MNITQTDRRVTGATTAEYPCATQEQDLLEKTLKSSVKVLTEVLGLASPLAFSRAGHIHAYVTHMAGHLKLADQWKYELAAMLSQLGCITLPEEILDKVFRGREVSAQERMIYDEHPGVGARLLAQIPRMEGVATMIAHQRGAVEGLSEDVRIGAEMLHLALAMDHMVAEGMQIQSALVVLGKQDGFDPALIRALEDFKPNDQATRVEPLMIRDLEPDMILDEAVCTREGIAVLGKGEKLHAVQIARLMSFARRTHIKEPIQVRLPAAAYSNS